MPPPSGATSLSLLARLRLKEPTAWDRLVYLYGPVVGGWCRAAGLRPADAEDVTQEVFAAVAVGLDQFRRDRPGDTFRGWLHGIARFKVLDHHRRAGRQAAAAGGTEAQIRLGDLPDPLAGLPEDDPAADRQLYRRALELVQGEFEPQTWQAFWRAAVDGHPVDAIAADLGVTPAGIRKAKSRVLRRLREETGELLD